MRASVPHRPPQGPTPASAPAEPAEPGLRNLRPRRAGLGTIETLLALGLIFAGAFLVLVVASVVWAVLAVVAHLAGAA
jgi:hypothetical protein